MIDFRFINSRGDSLSLVKGENYRLVNIDSQTSAATNLSSVVVGNADGDTVNNVQAQPRSLIFDLRIISEIEKTKRQILEVIKLKQQCRIFWSQNNREVEIRGVVEAIDMPRWTNEVTMQITLHCEQPFWEDVEFIVSSIGEAINLHYFTDKQNDMLYFLENGIVFGQYDTSRTKEIRNDGDVNVGLDIKIEALKTVTNPVIYNVDGNFFGCGYGTGNKKIVMQQGDIIQINTRKNEKSVTLNGVSIINKIRPLSTWLQLAAGHNEFSIDTEDVDDENVQFSLKYKQRYI